MNKPKIIFDTTQLVEGLQRTVEPLYETDVPSLRDHELPVVWVELRAGIRFEPGEVTIGEDGRPEFVVQVVPGDSIRFSPRLQAAVEEVQSTMRAMSATGVGTDLVN